MERVWGETGGSKRAGEVERERDGGRKGIKGWGEGWREEDRVGRERWGEEMEREEGTEGVERGD